ncbi:hypothetical protein B0T13DRAFT_20 [Neurospora crassa]|nr:hypothetical protein B0T13DRAFT_20 [Neurospora crassa]
MRSGTIDFNLGAVVEVGSVCLWLVSSMFLSFRVSVLSMLLFCSRLVLSWSGRFVYPQHHWAGPVFGGIERPTKPVALKAQRIVFGYRRLYTFFSSIAVLRSVYEGSEILLLCHDEPPFCYKVSCPVIRLLVPELQSSRWLSCFLSTALDASGYRFLHASGCTENVGLQTLQSR